MAWTLTDIVTTVQTEIKDASISATTLKEWYNDFVRELATNKKWRFFETSQDYTLTIGASDITNGGSLPSNLQMPNQLIITAVGFEGPLEYISFEKLVTMFPNWMNMDSGTPKYWYEYGGTIHTYPKTDVAHTATLYYQQIPTEQTADASVPEFSVDFREVIKRGIKKRFYDYRDKEDKGALEQVKIDELTLDLSSRYAGKQIGTVRIMPKSPRRSSLIRG